MPQQIEVPGLGIVEFPDGMSDADIVAAIKANPIRAQSADGVIHEFPVGTDPRVIDRVMKNYATGKQGNPWDAFPLVPQPSVGADVAKSGGIGLVKGGISLAGLPADAANWIGRGEAAILGGLGLGPAYDAARDTIPGGSSDIRKGVESM